MSDDATITKTPRLRRPRIQATIVALLDGTRTVGQVAAEADVSAAYVYKVMSRTQLNGKVVRSRGMRGTCCRADLRGCTDKELAWIRANIPKGGVVGGLMLMLVRDAMAEEN